MDPAQARREDESAEAEPASSGRDAGKLKWHVNGLLFAATVLAVFFAGAAIDGAIPKDAGAMDVLKVLHKGYRYAVPLLAILLFHEFGHYIAARIHKVRASLPYFIPAPFVNPFGTMGAVIAMPERIRSRNALLDIGAAGPLAGLVVALPVLAYGLATSDVGPVELPYSKEGDSLLYLAMKRIFVGPIPAGHDVHLNAIAFAGWTGLFVTALNLIPVGQLDGGHIAYALLGPKQDRVATVIHAGLLVVAGINLAMFVVPAVRSSGDVGEAIGNSTFYVLWFLLLAAIRWRTGMNHPPTDDATLSPRRRGVAALSLAFFVLLFMPTPWAQYGEQVAPETAPAEAAP